MVFFLEVIGNKCRFYIRELGFCVIGSLEEDRLEEVKIEVEKSDWVFFRWDDEERSDGKKKVVI